MPAIKGKILMKSVMLALILLLISQFLWSQVPVEISKDKVVISGIAYYIHQVKKGETVYSISKAYGVTVEELTKENPPAVYGINAGQTLRIPVKPVTETSPAQTEVIKSKHDDANFIYHIIKPGETIYFLSKTYDVSENEIVESNPGIDITKLSVGEEIAIPHKAFMTNRQKFDEPEKQQGKDKLQEKGFIYHKVESGESLSSIADKYGVSVRELRRANRDLRFPQLGDFVKVPGVIAPEQPEVVPVVADTVLYVVSAPVIRAVRPTGYTPVKDLTGSVNVAVLLPFYLHENSIRTEKDSSKLVRGRKTIKVTKRDDDWIYPRSLDFVEMYQGILLAADTLRSLGVNVNIHAFDIKKDTVELTKLIETRKLDGMNLIIGPVYSHNLSIVAGYAKAAGIPVVSPVPLFDNSVLSNNPELFLTSSSLEVAQETLARKISEYYDHNIIFINSDTLGIDEDVKRFRKLILSELVTKISYEDIRFKEFLFYNRSMFDNDSINRLSHAMSDRSKNLVIIASEEPPVISETLIDVHSLSKRFDVKVFGYPAIRDIDNLEPKYLFDLDIMLYYPYWIDYSSGDVIRFNSDFRKKFLTEPTEKSYAWQGYDIAYYFISGLAIQGKDFIRHPEIHHPDLLQTDYDFVSKDSGGGYENRNLFLIRYTKDYEVKLLEQDNVLQQY
jgi:LysM repeat protein